VSDRGAPPPLPPRAATSRAVADLYRAHASSPVLFAWTLPGLVRSLALVRGGARFAWPARHGRIDRALGACARSPALARVALVALEGAVAWQRARISLRRPPRASRAAAAAPCRVLLGTGADNEARIVAWRDRARPLETVPLDPDGGRALGRLAAGSRAAAAHRRLWHALRAGSRRVGPRALPPGLRAGAAIGFLTRVEAFLGTEAALRAVARRRPVAEVVASTLDERTFSAAAWGRRAGVPVQWVQHGFLALDVLPRAPGAIHHAFSREHARAAAEAGAPAEESAPPIGTSYFARPPGPLRRALLVATQGPLAARGPLGSGADALSALAERAAAAGWRVVAHAHRTERGGATEPLDAVLARERPAALATLYSTAALDGIASGAAAIFVCEPGRARDALLDDLARLGRVLDPRDPAFDAAARSALEDAARRVGAEPAAAGAARP
jgi:hypothetical protein